MTIQSPLPSAEPPHDCTRCSRLVDFRVAVSTEEPEWWNAPVPAFGDPSAWLAIVGLAPGKHGANRTGRPFTGDYAGDLLYATLARYRLSSGRYEARRDDDVELHGAIILNAVRCLPPQNKPTPEEIRTCRPYLEAALEALPHVKVVIALGAIAHQSAVKALGGRLPKAKFAHGAEHVMPDGRVLLDSYHCSRYNQNTRVLTPELFRSVFVRALELRSST